ncbi:FAD dependent oxidoreductase [Dendrothele bispora CBS 962.96]|uniref:FAD dependent oxidoreductase n=1 Tax=Dendrothele bispora (strain CBS 962.96) TaxID=1314807 RepID=A0A4S8L111_DENBC|nr:FAD dependent oxidoreductase [Dendrothele bispora CBS 962.96]
MANKSSQLRLGDTLSVFPAPVVRPSQYSPRILIIGGGVIGLITAWVLLDKGYRVTIVAKEWASFGKAQRLTSQISGALWEYPPAVCGQHTDTISLRHSKIWSMTSYKIFDDIASSPELSKASGVRMMPVNFFFPAPIEDIPEQFCKMKEIMSSGIRGFKRDAGLIQQRGISPTYGGAVDAYEHIAPVIDTDQAMGWLQNLVEKKGAKLITKTIHGDLFNQEDSLRAEYNADIIVNATGHGGIELAGDRTCYPIRGGLIRIINDGKDFPKIEHALAITADAAGSMNEIVFIVPRNDNILLLGGIAEPYEGTLDYTLDTPIIKRMRDRCERFYPPFKNARMDPDYPLAQGLRPFRQSNVRVERELRFHQEPFRGGLFMRPSRIVHSYGHGGAGWSLSFGCANDVLGLIEEALLDIVPKPLGLEDNEEALPGKIEMPQAMARL